MRPILTAALATTLAFAVAGCDTATARASESDGGPDATGTGAPQRIASLAASLDVGYTTGSADAPIHVVEFSDFGCPYCARFARATFPVLRQEFVQPGTVHWRYVPVTFGFPGGELMGKAAVCAADLGDADIFWRVHDLLYTRQTALRSPDARPRLLDWLAELGLDRDRLDDCIDDSATAATLRRHTQIAVDWYARGTPTFLVNGVPMSGALPVDFFRKIFATVLDPSGL